MVKVKMYCPSCGTELPPNAKFCSECGLEFEGEVATPAELNTPTIAPRRSPPSHAQTRAQPTRVQTNKPGRKAGKIFVSVLLVLALVGAAFAVVIVITWGSYKDEVTYSYDRTPQPTSMTWILNADDADMDIQYTTDTGAPDVQVRIQYDFAGGFLAGKTASDLYAITWNTDRPDGIMEFSMDRISWWGFPLFQNNIVTVTLKSGITFNITASTETGTTEMAILANENLTALSVFASTGDARVNLGENATITGKVDIHASTGSASFTMSEGSAIAGILDVSTSTGAASITATGGELASGLILGSSTGDASFSLDGTTLGNNIAVETSTGTLYATIANITASSSVHVDLSVSTGSMHVNVDQRVSAGANITANLETSTGDVHVAYKADDAHTSARFTTSVSTGTSHFTNGGGFTEVSPAEFRSTNQANPYRFDAALNLSTGSAYITGSMV